MRYFHFVDAENSYVYQFRYSSNIHSAYSNNSENVVERAWDGQQVKLLEYLDCFIIKISKIRDAYVISDIKILSDKQLLRLSKFSL